MRRKLLPFLFALLLISTQLVPTSHAALFACTVGRNVGQECVVKS
jgi:hypothetical protein